MIGTIMSDANVVFARGYHSHVFLAPGHEGAERRTWAVIWLCGAMMALEIIGGALFGSIALVADGLHMSTHAGALLLAALAYSYSRKHADDPRFTFGTGKLGDLAGFTSAIVLAMIALLIGYAAVMRFIAPVAIHFRQAIPIACLGLGVNIVSAWLLSGGGHHHHGHSHGHDENGPDEEHRIKTSTGALVLSVFEDKHPPVFRIRTAVDERLPTETVTIETIRPAGDRQTFAMVDRGGYLESVDEIPEPHAFTAELSVDGHVYRVVFEEHEHEQAHSTAHRDNNMRAAIIHVVADAAVSVLVIVGLVAARVFGWLWMDPLAGIIGACVIGSWSYGLIRDTGAILLDVNPDRGLTDNIRRAIEDTGASLNDLHLWRLGPGHLGAVLSVTANDPRDPQFYHDRLARFDSLSHVTVEVQRAA
jgi:cation diffusion facilitator family transporter